MRKIAFVVIGLGIVVFLGFTPMVVTTLNGLTGNVQLAAGSGITVTPSGQTITISANIPPQTPRVVASQSFLDQSAPLSTTLFTSTTEGNYRVNAYWDGIAATIPPGAPGGGCIFFSWSDVKGPHTIQGVLDSNTAVSVQSHFMHNFHLPASTAITVAIPSNANCSVNPDYDLYLQVEQL